MSVTIRLTHYPVRSCVASVEDGSARDAEVLIQYGASSIQRPQTSDTPVFRPNDGHRPAAAAHCTPWQRRCGRKRDPQGRTIASVHEPARRFRLPGLRLARSETHQLLRVLRERRKGGRLERPRDRTVGTDEKPKPEFRTEQLDSGSLKPPNPTPVGAADTGAIDHSHKG